MQAVRKVDLENSQPPQQSGAKRRNPMDDLKVWRMALFAVWGSWFLPQGHAQVRGMCQSAGV